MPESIPSTMLINSGHPEVRDAMHVRLKSGPRLVSLLVLALASRAQTGIAQCAGIVSNPRSASDCAAHTIPEDKIATIDPSRLYTLAELIDIAEHNNPRTRIFWERAKQSAEQLGIQKSAYYPVLAGLAVFSDERIISPFPK